MSTTLTPTSQDLPKLMNMLEVHRSGDPNANSAIMQMRYVLEEMDLIPRDPERASERAMRNTHMARMTRNPVPPVSSLDDAIALAKDVRFRDWSAKYFWGLMRSFAEDYESTRDVVLAKVKKAFKIPEKAEAQVKTEKPLKGEKAPKPEKVKLSDGEEKLVRHINDSINLWNPVRDI